MTTEELQMEKINRIPNAIILGTGNFLTVGGLLGIFGGMAQIMFVRALSSGNMGALGPIPNLPGPLFPILLIITSVIAIAAGAGLLKYKQWAWGLAVSLIGLDVVFLAWLGNFSTGRIVGLMAFFIALLVPQVRGVLSAPPKIPATRIFDKAILAIIGLGISFLVVGKVFSPLLVEAGLFSKPLVGAPAAVVTITALIMNYGFLLIFGSILACSPLLGCRMSEKKTKFIGNLTIVAGHLVPILIGLVVFLTCKVSY